MHHLSPARPRPDMSVHEFVATVVSRDNSEIDPKERKRRRQFRHVVALLAQYFDFPPIGEFNSASIDAAANAYVKHGGSVLVAGRYRVTLRHLLRRAIECGAAPPDPSAESWVRTEWNEAARQDRQPAPTEGKIPEHDPGPPGTLWHIAVTEYFPCNVRILSAHTHLQYRRAFDDLGHVIGHPPTPADLTDDNVVRMMKHLLEEGRSRPTVNNRRDRINALWTWLAKRRRVEQWPTNLPIKEPRRTPRAWNEEELGRLFDACRQQPGHIGCIPAAVWWYALHVVLWDSGARIGELMAARWEWLDTSARTLHVPAENRKGGECDMLYTLHPDTLETLATIPRRDDEPLIFPWPRSPLYLWERYKKVLRSAGLPVGRNHSFHRVRRSVASHVQAAGLDASNVLGHSSPMITRKSYLDPSIARTKQPADVLFRPGTANKAEPTEFDFL